MILRMRPDGLLEFRQRLVEMLRKKVAMQTQRCNQGAERERGTRRFAHLRARAYVLAAATGSEKRSA